MTVTSMTSAIIVSSVEDAMAIVTSGVPWDLCPH
jgi:hypothetical protein